MDIILEYCGFKVGDYVTVNYTEELYDKKGFVEPNEIGIIKRFSPKVRKVPKSLKHDRKDYFAYVIFDEENNLRAGIDICNLKRV